MRILVKTVAPSEVIGVITYENRQVSFSTPAAREVFNSARNKRRPVVPALSVPKTINVLRSWSNGYVLTEVEK